MKRTVLVLALLLAAGVGSAVPVAAQQGEISPEHLAAARTYVDITDRSAVYESTLIKTAVNTMRTILRTNPDIVEPVDAAITKALEVYRERKDELLNQFARVYALNFTIEELQEINAFYESDVGKKLVTANAALNQDMQRIVGVFEANLSTEFFASVKANLKEAGYNI